MLIDYVGFTVSERHMCEQFEYGRQSAAPRQGPRILRVSLPPLRRGLAALLRQAADRLEPGSPVRVAIDSREA
jgi:hypothetical protein